MGTESQTFRTHPTWLPSGRNTEPKSFPLSSLSKGDKQQLEIDV